MKTLQVARTLMPACIRDSQVNVGRSLILHVKPTDEPYPKVVYFCGYSKRPNTEQSMHMDSYEVHDKQVKPYALSVQKQKEIRSLYFPYI